MGTQLSTPIVEQRSIGAQEPTRTRRGVDLMHSEWIKLRSSRTTWYLVAAAFVAAVGIGALAANSDVRGWDQMTAAQRAGVDPLADAFIGFMASQLLLASLGVLAFTGGTPAA